MTPKQKLAVQLKARGLSDTQIAKQLGISTMTLRRWWKEKEVQQALDEAVESFSQKLDDVFVSFDKSLSDAATESIERVKMWTQECYNKAQQAEDANEATKWLSIAFRGEALLLGAYLRRFAKTQETSESTMRDIVNEAIRLMFSGELEDDQNEFADLEDSAMETRYSQVRGGSTLGSESENGTTSTAETV